MRKFCLKCSFLSEIEQVAFDTACPRCGAIYAKLEEAAKPRAGRENIERANIERSPPPKAESRRWWSSWRGR